MRQANDGFRPMGVDPLFDADLVSAVCFNHTDPFWGDLDGILFSRFSKRSEEHTSELQSH